MGTEQATTFLVTEAEHGQKLLQLLMRRLRLERALLHRWIRTGQIRRNAGRTTPFVRVCVGDVIRLPPFAYALSEREGRERPVAQYPLPPSLGCHADIVAYVKPSGLPTHAGSGHSDSLASRIAAHACGAPFVPVPCHRLDKDTSGIVLVARSYTALRWVTDALAAHSLRKEYLSWVWGAWPATTPLCLHEYLEKQNIGGYEKVCVDAAKGREAITWVTPLVVFREKSLLLLSITTGRTHQIRVQLAHAGYPVVHDSKYGDPRRASGALLLHAYRVVLPDGHIFTCPPAWKAPYAVEPFLSKVSCL